MEEHIISSDLSGFIKYTMEVIGKPVESRFNTLYNTYPSKLPNNAGEVSIFADPTGDKGPFDVHRRLESKWYSIEPDVWIGELGLYDESVVHRYRGEIDMYRSSTDPLFYLVVLRRLGDPSVNYCVENKTPGVFLMTRDLGKDYYEFLVQDKGYATLSSKLISIDYVETNFTDFHILEK